jgi:hypothetical protein
MPSFVEMLSNKQAYPDTQSVTLPYGSVSTLGDLRQSVGSRTELEAQRREIEQAQQAVIAMYDQIQRQQQAAPAPQQTARPAQTGGYDYLSDPYLGELVRQFQAGLAERDAIIKELRGHYGKLEKQLNDTAQIYFSREWNRDWESIPERFEDVKMEQALKYAVDNGIKDRFGAPDIKRAHDIMTEPRRAEKMKEKLLAEAREQAEREHAVKSMSRRSLTSPLGGDNANAGSAQNSNNGNRPTSIAEAFNSAKQDTSVMASLMGASSVS